MIIPKLITSAKINAKISLYLSLSISLYLYIYIYLYLHHLSLSLPSKKEEFPLFSPARGFVIHIFNLRPIFPPTLAQTNSAHQHYFTGIE
jgi:hypothetical protein